MGRRRLSSKAAPAPVVPEGAQAGELTGLKGCEFQPADGKTKYAAECSTLIVPENWDKAGSRLIALPVVRIPATGRTWLNRCSSCSAAPVNQTYPGRLPIGCSKTRRGDGRIPWEDGTVVLKCPNWTAW